MAHAIVDTKRQGLWTRTRKWIAGTAAAALVGGLLVVAGVGAQSALAEVPAPGVAVEQRGTYLAGEDLSLDLTFSSAGAAAGNEYNLSAGIVLPQGVTVIDSGTLGAPVVYTGRTLPLGSPAAERVALTGNYSKSWEQCEALGLEPLTANQASGACVVPDGMQYLVFQNISDLPEGASATHTITLRPDADVFPVGSTIGLDVTAYTSSAERYIPVFPGSTGVAAGSAHTSDPGSGTTSVLVNALRLEKSEPSLESELLRGVHTNPTTYTLRVWHTGEGDIDDVVVTDFIPAGLEYLGLGGAAYPDRTTDANGTQGLVEYPDAPRIDTPAPAPSTWGGPNAALNAAQPGGETVTTRVATADDAAAHPGVVAGDVYTVVSWSIGELLKTGLASYSILDPVAQNYADDAGEPGFFEIRYRAAVPLFENTVDFDGAGIQPTADGGRHQIANLDNNRGASTRHGSEQTSPGFDDDGSPKRYTNVATASGVYNGDVADPADRDLSDTGTVSIDAVDVRLLKSVDDDEFTQGGLATYTLDIRTSEYTSADLGAGGSGAIRPNRLVDDLGDGICPVFPPSVDVTPNANPNHAGIPNFIIGDPNDQDAIPADKKGMSQADWNAALGTSLASVCGFPSSRPGAALTGTPGATTLTGIAYNPASGHFYLDLNTAALGANGQQLITYTALQNTVYSEGGGEPGATSSGDTIVNTAELMMTTQSIPGLDGVTSSGTTGTTGTPGDVADGTWRAWDDSDATLHARLSELSKHVLKRSAGVPERDEIAELAEVPESEWVKTPEENEPFAVGDQVWYRIKITPPAGADVRNPKFTDFLPVGVKWDPAINAGTGRPENMWIVPSSLRGIGECQPSSKPGDPIVNWLNTFAEFDSATDFDADGNILTFKLGADHCFPASGNTDRFLPLDTTLEIYLKVTVVDAAAFATVDLPQNLAKYQQNNVDGDIFFLRDMAEIEVDGGPRLLKGIRSNTNADSPSRLLPTGYYPYNSNVDGTPTSETVVQGDEVTFRLDVSAPRTGTTNYQVWDALPVGVKAADIKTGSYSAATVTQTWQPPVGATPGGWLVSETPAAGGTWTATAYDPGSYPPGVSSQLRPDIIPEQRTIIVWSYTGSVPGSIVEDDSALPAAIPGAFQGITLGYTIVVPDGTDAAGGPAAELTQRYQNDASIVQFAYRGNSGTDNEVIVNGSENLADDRDPAAGVFELDDENNVTSDPSGVYVLGAEIDKERVGSQIPSTTTPAVTDTNNTASVFVEGETVNYTISVTLPGNTTVADGILKDRGVLTWTGSPNVSGRSIGYDLVTSSVAEPTALPTGFAFDSATGVLTFPDEYTTGAVDETFTIALTVRPRVQALNLTQAQRDQFHGKALTNTGDFQYTAHATGQPANLTDTATATYRDPKPTLAKTATPTTVGANGTVTYTLTPGNTSNRPTLYDVTVLDCVPAEISVATPLAPTAGSATAAVNACHIDDDGEIATSGGTNTGTLITWTFERLDTTPAPTLSYTGTVTPSAGGGSSFSNYAELSGYTLPGSLDPGHLNAGTRTATDDATVDVSYAELAKSVSPASAPVGETVTYSLTTTLPARANFYDVALVDTLPTGLSYAGSPTIAFGGDWGGNLPDIAAAPSVSGQQLTWPANGNVDIAFAETVRTITITFQATITDSVVAAAPRNTGVFSWNTVNGDDDTGRSTPPATADVTILNPVVQIVKKVDGQDSITRNPDATFDYTLQVRNTGTTPAHKITVEDVVPAGVIVSGISPAATTVDAGVAAGLGGKITWTFTGPLAVYTDGVDPSEQIGITYEGEFVASAQLNSDDFPYENVVNVTRYESFDQDGWVYTPPVRNTDDTTTPGGNRPGGAPVPAANDDADVTPIFPSVVLAKTVSDRNTEGDIAYAGQPFWWNLRATNAGAGDTQNIEIRDALPVNWSYDTNVLRAPEISVNGVNWFPLEAPTGTTNLVWSETQIRDALEDSGLIVADAPVIPGKVGTNPSSSIQIRFSAIPSTPALTTPGVTHEEAGPPPTIVRPPHTNTLTAVAEDTRGDSGRQGVPSYAPGDPTADAFIHAADLKIVKSAIGGTTGGAPEGNQLHGIAADKWVIGADVGTYYTQPQWSITVTNHGPDASFGPFAIADTLDLPAGVTTGSWSARYFAPGATTGVVLDVTPTGTGTTANPLVLTVGGNGTSLRADGTDRLVLTADVTIDRATAQPGETVENEASVEGRTYEPDAKKGPAPNPNPNTDDASRDLDESADLAVTKTVASGTVNAGGSISWTITPYNNGPSVSRNSVAKPITISDTIPAGVIDVTYPFADPATAMWTVTLNGEPWDPAADPAVKAQANDTIVFTLKPAFTSMAVGSHTPITLSGTVRADWAPTSTSPSGDDGRIVNTATITSRITPDPVTPNNTDDAEPTITFNTDLQISKTRVKWDAAGGTGGTGAWVPDTDPVQAGARVNYLINVSNNGNAVARNVQVTDQAPTPELSYVSYVNIAPADWGAPVAHGTNPNWQVFTLGSDLLVGEMRSFVATYDSQPDGPDNVENCVVVASASNSLTDTDCATFDSDRVADLAISKRVIDGAGGTVVDPESDATTTAGSAVWYRLVVTNVGPSNAVGPIQVEDTLPENFSYVAGSATVGGAASTPTVSTDASGKKSVLTWANVLPTGQILVDGTLVIEFQVTVAADHLPATGIVNSAEVDSAFDTNPANDTDTTPIKITRLAEMEITKAVSDPAAGPWLAGTDVEYTLTIVNDGPSAAPAQVVDTLPAGLTLKSWSSDDWVCTGTAGTQSLSCAFESSTDTDPVTGLLHPVGAAAATEITVVAHIASNLPTTSLTNPFVNRAVLTWTDSREFPDPSQDPRTDDDDASITVTTQADLGLVKTAVDPADDLTEVTSAVAGEQARYRINVTNYGPSDAAPDLVVTDTLPLGVSYVGPAGDTASNWEITATAYSPTVQQVVTFTRVAGAVNVGLPMVNNAATDAPAILFDVLLSPSLQPTDAAGTPPVVPLVNTASVTSGTPEPAVDPHPNTDDAPLNVVRSADLAIEKSHASDANGQVHVGDALDFTIQVTNHGPSVSSGFTVTDTVPVGLEVTSAVGPVAGTSWTIDSITLVDPLDPTAGATVVATYGGTLGVQAGIDNAADPLVLSTLIHENAHGTAANHVEITAANEPDPEPGNNEWDDPLDVTPVVKLVVEKTAVGEFQVGKTGTYRITVENQGPHADPGPITVTDALPNGLVYESSPKLPAGVDVAVTGGKTVVWTLTNGLAVGETVEIELRVHVQQAAFPEVTNTVVIESPADLTPDSVLSDDETVPVKALDLLTVTGASAIGYLALAAALLMLGGALVAATRRRRELTARS